MMKRFWRTLEVLAWAAFFAFAAMVLALRYWLLPDIERYRGEIVARVTQTVGQPVKIGGIQAGWQGLRPQISLSDVRIYDADGREALRLPAVDNVVSWRSLLFRELRLHSLIIEGPRLAVRRDAGGALYVAGMKLGKGEEGFSDWILGQREIEIRSAEVEWRDEKRAAPPLALAGLNLRLRNAGAEHSLGLTARPPASLGSSVELRARLAGRSVTDAPGWKGRLYAELGTTDLAAWRAWLDYPIDVQHGQGALRVWATLENGELREATADVALTQVAARLARNLAPLELASVQGRLHARVHGARYELSGRDLALAAARGPRMQPTDFQLAWKAAGEDGGEDGALSARLIELEPLAHLIESLPVPAELRKLVSELEPRGRLADAKLEWHGTLAAPLRFSARARFADLGMRPWHGAPGFAGLSGSIEATESKGRLYLLSRNSELSLPQVFPDPRIAFDALSAQVEWEREGGRGFSLRLSSVNFANPDLAGSAFGSYSASGAGPGRIDLSASLARAEGGRAEKYLPLGAIMGPQTRDWLASAILAGQASDVHLRLRGELGEFPFPDPATGQFQVSARFKKGVLNYGDGWPGIHDIEGELLFEREKMEIVGRSASILGAKLANVRVSIPSLTQASPHLLVSGQAEAPTSEFLKYIESSPVRGMTDGLTAAIAASGHGKLRLKLDLPLAERAATRVAGEYEFTGNQVTLHPQLPPIERAGGKLSFTESGFAVHDVRGRLFGGAVAISGGSRPGGDIEVQAKGDATVTAAALLADHPLRRYLSGGSSYAATVNVREGLIRISFESSLRGVTSALPPPLEKAAAEALPLRVDVIPVDGGARDRVSVSLGRLAAAEFLRRKQGEAMLVQRAAVWLSPVAGGAIRLPERPGTLIYGSLPALDLDRWLPLYSSEDSAAAAAAFELDVGTLDVYGKRLRNVALKAGADPSGWSAAVNAEELAGDVSYRREAGGQLVARLAHFTMPEDYPGPKLQQSSEPAELPAIDLVAERFTLRGKQLGRIEVLASRAGQDWRIDKLAMVNPDAVLRAKGAWRGGAPSRSAIDFQLETSDAGKFLARVGYPDLVLGGKAQLQGGLTWHGEPVSLDFATLSGHLKLRADDGQFLEIEPGIGKLVSLMSLQALPRRIALDFRDVFSKGFQFDRIDAAARVEAGVMAIDEFRMRGSAAEVDMSGQADLARETQDLRVRVIPSLGDSASTVVGIVNPLAGVAAAIAQRVLKNPLGQIFAYDYSVTGSWSDPKVAKLAVEAPPPIPESATP